jgi:DNA-directed RNA polymerase subunit beta'
MASKEKCFQAHMDGRIGYINLKTYEGKDGSNIVLNKEGFVGVYDATKREVARYRVRVGDKILVADGSDILKDQPLLISNKSKLPIITERSGIAHYLGNTPNEGQKPSHITIVNDESRMVAGYFVPKNAILSVEEGQRVEIGDELAYIPTSIEMKSPKQNEETLSIS